MKVISCSKKSTYVPTGFPRGRPRKGEIRPYNKRAALKKERYHTDSTYRERALAASAAWIQAHPERKREYQRAYLRRRSAWNSYEVGVAKTSSYLIVRVDVKS